jgi:SAM-dependent methyltransferase
MMTVMSDETGTDAGRAAERAARARSFDGAAGLYAANRPSYPPALFDALEEASGIGLAGARVADVGAGTGIATGLLAARGARVVGVEPGAGMAAECRRRLPPGVPVVRGDGNALPLADASVDLLTYAQSWHWTDRARSVPEALRVLRPGGALALWWNTLPRDVPWITAQEERLARHFGERPRPRPRPDGATARRVAGVGLPLAHREVRWSRTVPLGTHLANLASQSAFLTGGPAAAALLEAERALLAEEFTDGLIEEVYVAHLLVAARPA